MSRIEKGKLKVHKDISSRFRAPYWHVEVNRDPRFPLDQYRTQLKDLLDKYERFKDPDIQYLCGYCKSEDMELLLVDVVLSNSGGWKNFEFKCKRCGVYTFYNENEFS